MQILAEAAAWLKRKGIDQWPSPPNEHWQRRMAAAIDRQEIYLIGVDQKWIGIVRLTWDDPYWPDDGLAIYVHSMAIRPKMRGQNIGKNILNWAVAQAQQKEKQYIRLDCLAKNKRLCRYYEEQGFIYQTKLTDHDYTAALYQKTL